MDIRSLLSPANEPAVPVGSGDESSSNPAVALRKAAKPTHSSTSFVHAHRNTQSREHHFIEQHSDHSANVARQSRPTQMTAGSRSHRNQQQQQSLRVADSNEQISHHPDLNRQIPVHLTAESTDSRSRAPSRVNGSSSNTPSGIGQQPQSPRGRKLHPPTHRTLSNRSLASVTMDTAQTPTPRNFTSDALSTEELGNVTALLSYLNEHSYAYDSHVQLINLLHKGFVAHCSDVPNQSPEYHARTYGLLSELQQAREAMDVRFAVGQALWLDWLRDEVMLARSSEERLALMELMQRAVQDEPASVALWQLYVDWLEQSYAACYDLPGAAADGWSEEDKALCREMFTRQTLLDVMAQSAESTKWRMDASQVLWQRYLEALQTLSDQDTTEPSISDVELEQLFVDRLRIPHSQLDTTFELFMPVAERLYSDNFDKAITRFEKIMEKSRKQVKARDAHESKIQYAIDTNDRQGLYEAFEQYLKWDRSQKQRSDNHKELRCALFERALLQFPTNNDWWIAYIDYVISQQPSTHNPSASILPLIERATRHCPWSGELWARRILRSDYERRPHDYIEATKHTATNSGLLDVGGMDDLLKVLVEWCSYLRRHAFSATATEDEFDTAEVGITMALEDVQQAGKKLYGPEFQGDPLWRIEKIQIKFFSEARRMNDTRTVWRSLVQSKKDSWEFWQQYYMWEITLWIHDRQNDSERVETTETRPVRATAVVEEAIAQHNLDWPEKVHEMYVNHFQWHESVEKVQDATIVAWAFQQKIAAKRAKDAAALAAAQPVQATVEEHEPPNDREKRKRESDTATEPTSKKTKTEQSEDQATKSASVEPLQKRDREHLTITATNLPADITELDVRKFFRDCGEILSLALVADSDKTSATAVVEFGSAEEAAAAKTRTGKSLRSRTVQVKAGTMSTLYVANYPPELDESAIRKLFSAYGEIASVRFPSLKYNNRRRFCYVQFVTSEQAKAAEEALDGKMLDGSHRLLAKISDPDAKKQRSGAKEEQRELFVKNIDNNASEADVRALFAQHGDVLSINLLKNVTGRRLGNGFVIFASAEQATKAIEALNSKPFNDRILHVELAQSKAGTAPSEKARKTDIIVKHDDAAHARRGSDVSMTSTPAAGDEASDSYKTVRERQVALLDLPDTVTDARVTAEMEQYGPVIKIQLRREQDGAIIEFADVKTAFTVRQGMQCTALGPKTRTGDVKELFAKKSKAKSSSGLAMMPTQLSRPSLASGSRRGGLGFKRGGLASSSKAETDKSKVDGGNKSNADFKSLFEKSRQQ